MRIRPLGVTVGRMSSGDANNAIGYSSEGFSSCAIYCVAMNQTAIFALFRVVFRYAADAYAYKIVRW
jgi:hypothetical protein